MLPLILTLMLQGGVFTSYAEGERWDFAVRGRDVEKAPPWRDIDDAPPLPPRAAVRSARLMLSKLVKHGSSWELGKVSLQPIAGAAGVWVYLVEFTSPVQVRAGAMVGSSLRQQLTVVVMMNGTAISPDRRPAQAGR